MFGAGEESNVRIHVLTIGDELLDGQVIDSNTAWLGAAIVDMGLSVSASSTERDDRAQLVATFERLCAEADVLICSGGLGPTVDDITVECLAEAAGVDRAHHQPSWDRILQIYGEREVPESNRQQALIPVGGEALETRVGTAPGVWLKVGECDVFAVPGVPREMRWHFETHVAPRLLERAHTARRHIRSRAFVIIGESDLAARVDALNLPERFTPVVFVGTEPLSEVGPEIDVTLAHELGHAMGLVHQASPRDLMADTVHRCEPGLRAEQADQLMGYRRFAPR